MRTLLTYEDTYLYPTAKLICDYFDEVHCNDSVASIDKAKEYIRISLKEGKAIYLLKEYDDIIGFLIMSTNDQNGMTKMVVNTDAMFIIPSFRTSISIMYLYTMAGLVCEDLSCDNISTTFHSSSNINNNRLTGGIPIATVYRFPLEVQLEKLKQYKKRIKR